MASLNSELVLFRKTCVRCAWPLKRTITVVIILAFQMVACNQTAPDQPTPLPITPTDTLVPFSVLLHEINASAPMEPSHGAMIRLIQSQEDIPGVQPFIDPYFIEPLNGVDFEQSIVVVLFHGIRSSTEYDIDLQSVVVRENDVVFDCRLSAPGPDDVVGLVLTSPFIAVTIRRGDLPSRIEALVMLNQGAEMARQTLR